MGAELPIGIRVAAQPRARPSLQVIASRALRGTTKTWFAITIFGQLLFAFAAASFYGRAAVSGDVQMLNRFMFRGYVAGDRLGNAAVAMHLASAVLIIVAGALQFVPQFRSRFPAVHRWSGRTYMLTAFTLSAAGVYMHWFRGSFGDALQKTAGTLNAVLIWGCAAMALRYAIGRDFRMHRRWALRLFLAVSASWFFRIVFFFWAMVFGPVGFDPNTFTGPFLTIASFAVYLVPLALLELWFLAQDSGVVARLAMSATLGGLTLATAAGIVAVTAAVWAPSIKAAYDTRKPIGTTLSDTIEKHGIDRAVQQYRELKATADPRWNFDERQLNTLGYQLLRADRTKEAIRIFRLNTEAYPASSNVWDSLAEGYLKDGDRESAIANYRKALQLDPKNAGSAAALEKLTRP